LISRKNRQKKQFVKNSSSLIANQPKFSKKDEYFIQNFVMKIKILNGDWSKNGIQRLVRIKSECSHKYITLRNNRIRANVPFEEAFFDQNSNKTIF